MKPGDTINDLYVNFAAIVNLDDNKAYYVSCEDPVAKITICLVTRDRVNRQHATVLKIYYEGFGKPECGFLEALIQHLPIEDLPILAVHHTSGIRDRALARLQRPESLP